VPALAFFGYSWMTVVLAMIVLYAGYIVIKTAAGGRTRSWSPPPASGCSAAGELSPMPACRYFVFWLRFAGVLTV
jgi:hypothetical protein